MEITPMKPHLVILTRYPEPHKTKTRLIPALGPEGAARLQREMTLHTIDNAREFAHRSCAAVEVRFEGGDAKKMQTCFGNSVLYRPQGPGDLGCRLQRAFAEASSGGANRIIVIGADCPEITPALIAEAHECLATHDLVLGPARDGGYYLIGLRKPAPQLFQDIPWGSERVLDETVRRASELSMTVSLLKTLSDVDRPEDLAVWHRAKHQPASASSVSTISVIIPTLNEANYLPRTLDSLRDAENIETIVVDGGSRDGTLGIAERQNCRVLRSQPGRARQLNAGAHFATGSILLFLHADTQLSPGFDLAVRSTLSGPGTVGGAFRLCIDARGWPMRAIERAVDIRSRLFQMPYGDQGIFVRKQLFYQFGGFPLLPIMDDYEFVRRLRRKGKIQTVHLPATTSGRRWQQLGPWRTTWINQKIILGYRLGFRPEQLAAWYRSVPGSDLRRCANSSLQCHSEDPNVSEHGGLSPESIRQCNE